MNRIKEFFRTTVIGGVTVLLPGVVLLLILRWVWVNLQRALAPISDPVVTWWGLTEWQADLLGLLVVVAACFAVGLVVRVSLGRRLIHWFESSTVARLPGYGSIKEVISYFARQDQAVFSQPVLVTPTAGGPQLTGFVADRYGDTVTVFVPTGPNPTSGLIIHVPAERVVMLRMPVNRVFKTIISCGVGSGELLAAIAATPTAKATPP